jgi:hypothetical protein
LKPGKAGRKAVKMLEATKEAAEPFTSGDWRSGKTIEDGTANQPIYVHEPAVGPAKVWDQQTNRPVPYTHPTAPPPPTIADQVVEIRTARVTEKKRRYSELMQTEDPENIAELEELAEDLGLSNDQLTADVRLMREALRIEQQLLVHFKGVTAARDRTQKLLDAHLLETARIQEERRATELQLDKAAHEALMNLQRAAGADSILRKLCRENPDLLYTVAARGVRCD